MKRSLFVILAIVLSFVFVSESAAVPQGKVYFTANHDTDKQTECWLYSVNLDGKDLRDWKIPVSSISRLYPAPDKSGKLLVNMVRAGNEMDSNSIRVYDATGKEVFRQFRVNENTNEVAMDPMCSWLPDGKQILYTTVSTKDPSAIWRVNISNRKRNKVLRTSGHFFIANPLWSPDSKCLACAYFIMDETLKGDAEKDSLLRFYVVSTPLPANSKTLDLSRVEQGTRLPAPAKPIADTKIFYLQMNRFLEWSRDSKRLGFFSPKLIDSVLDSEENHQFVASLDDPMLYVYDFPQKRLYKQSLKETKDTFIIDAALSRNGKKFAAITLGGIWLWNVGDDKLVQLQDNFMIDKQVSAPIAGFPHIGIPLFRGAVGHLEWLDDRTILFSTDCQLFRLDVVKKEAVEIYKDTDMHIQNITVSP